MAISDLTFPHIPDEWDYAYNLEYNIKNLLIHYFGEEWVRHRFCDVEVKDRAIYINLDADTGFIYASQVYYICVNFLNDNWSVIEETYYGQRITAIYVDWT